MASKIVLGEVRFSYAHVFEPYSFEDGKEPKYSVTILIPKSDTALVAKVNKAIEEAYNEAVTQKWGGKKPPMKLATPLRDGDESDKNGEPRGEAYVGMYFLNAKSNTKPQVVKKEGNAFFPIVSTDDFYSGCYGHVSVAFGGYDNSGNKGISCYLNNLFKSRDGEPLGVGQTSAADDFASLLDSDDEM